MSSSSGSGGSQDIETEEEETLEQLPLPSEAKYKVTTELTTNLREDFTVPGKGPY